MSRAPTGWLRRAGQGLGALMLAAAAMALGSPLAEAAAPAHAGGLVVRRIDSTAMPAVKVDVAVTGGTADPGGFTLREGGAPARDLRAATLVDAKTPVGTVLLIDTATSMNDANKMSQVRTAAKGLVQAKGPNEQMAVVAYGATPRVVQDLTADPVALSGAIDRLAIGGTPALYAGVRMAANLLINRSDLLPNMVIIGDSGNTGALAKASDALADLEASKATTYSIGLQLGAADLGALSQLANAGRGTFLRATDAAGVARSFAIVHDALASQFELTYTSRLKKGSADLVVALPGLQAPAQLVPGGVAVGAATNPAPVHVRQAPPILRGRLGLALIAGLVLAAAALLAYAVAVLVSREDNSLTRALRPYNEAGDEEGEGADAGLLRSALMQAAVKTTERLAQEQGLLEKVESKLEQADLALRPAEALLFYGVGVILVMVAAVAAKGAILGLIVAALAGITPPAALSLLAKRRLKRFNSQLPDTLQLLASSLRAGFSFLQGVEAVAAEVDNPMGSELRRVIIEARLGRPVEQALDDCAARMKSPDFDWAVMAVGIQREVGGNLAELLQTVSVTMIERERLRRDVKALTAEGRMSAIVLGCLPPGLGLFFYVSNPHYMAPLFNRSVGQIALGLATLSMLVGFVWMNKCIQIEV